MRIINFSNFLYGHANAQLRDNLCRHLSKWYPNIMNHAIDKQLTKSDPVDPSSSEHGLPKKGLTVGGCWEYSRSESQSRRLSGWCELRLKDKC